MTKFPPTTRKYSRKQPEKSHNAFRRAEKIWKRSWITKLGKIKMREFFRETIFCENYILQVFLRELKMSFQILFDPLFSIK